MRVISSTLGALALAVVTAGCGGSSSTSPTPTPNPTPTPTPTAGQVSIVGERGNQSFNPNPTPQSASHTVVWTNNDGTIHRVVADDGSFDTGNLSQGQSSAVITVAAAGKTYHCSIHPSMVGTVSAAN